MTIRIDPASLEEDLAFHSYTTHRIPWYVRLLWVGFWVGGIWYVIKYGIPYAKMYF